MSVDLLPLETRTRLLFQIPLAPLQGHRFQPTGFPNLGAATYTAPGGQQCLLVESAQSMANRLELTFWDAVGNKPAEIVKGISHVTVTRKNRFLTDSMLEPHRINSPYLLAGKDRTFFEKLRGELGALEEGPIDRALLARVLLKYDVGSLLHGAFLAKKELAGGRLRVSRALSAFIEAEGVRVAASGGVKNDHVNPSGDAKEGFGNVPFARDEYTAERITLYANLDLAQLRGYRLGPPVVRMLALMALYKLRALVSGDMRLRTACDLAAVSQEIVATSPAELALPSTAALEGALRGAIAECAGAMTHTELKFEDEIRKAKAEKEEDEDEADEP